MKIENIQDAASAASAYETAKSNLAHHTKCLYFSTVSDNAPFNNAKTTDMSGPSGDLARDIQAALIKFDTAHLEMAKDSLRKLGVEIS